MANSVSITMARRILGDAAKELTDTQVKEMLITLKLLAKESLVYNGSKVESKYDDATPFNS